MGNGASSSVKSININSSKQTRFVEERNDETTSFGAQKIKPRNEISQNDPSHVQDQECIEKGENMLSIKNQLAAVESENLDLLDRIHLLEGQIEYLNTENLLQRQKEGCEETIHAKDQYIKKLEKETEVAQEDCRKLKLKLKRKLKTFSTQLTEVKQESSIQAFELKDEVSRLTEENKCLLEKLRLRGSQKVADESEGFMVNNPIDDGRSKLILDLSQQLNDQCERIEELEQSIRERDIIIKDMKHLQRNDIREGSLNEKDTSKPTRSETSSKKTTDNCDNVTSREKGNSDSEIAEMRSIMEEMKSLHRPKRRSKEKSVAKETVRGSSGKSRDSGVISPDLKLDSELTNGRPVSAVSLLSNFSLTDSEQGQFSKHGTVHSAPVGMTRTRPPIHSVKIVNSDKYETDSEKHLHKDPSTKRKKTFVLKQRLEPTAVSGRPYKKLNSLADTHSDVDTESELLSENFRQDPLLNILSPSSHVSVR